MVFSTFSLQTKPTKLYIDTRRGHFNFNLTMLSATVDLKKNSCSNISGGKPVNYVSARGENYRIKSTYYHYLFKNNGIDFHCFVHYISLFGIILVQNTSGFITQQEHIQ